MEFFDEDDTSNADAEPLDDEMFLAMNEDDPFSEDVGFDDFDEFGFDEEQRERAQLDELSSSDTVGLYLKEMARVPLLSTEEEINLAQRIEARLVVTRQLALEQHGSRCFGAGRHGGDPTEGGEAFASSPHSGQTAWTSAPVKS